MAAETGQMDTHSLKLYSWRRSTATPIQEQGLFRTKFLEALRMNFSMLSLILKSISRGPAQKDSAYFAELAKSRYWFKPAVVVMWVEKVR